MTTQETTSKKTTKDTVAVVDKKHKYKNKKKFSNNEPRKPLKKKDVNAPPSTAADFSSNWQVFLNNQSITTASTATTTAQQQLNTTRVTSGKQTTATSTKRTRRTEQSPNTTTAPNKQLNVNKSRNENTKRKRDSSGDVESKAQGGTVKKSKPGKKNAKKNENNTAEEAAAEGCPPEIWFELDDDLLQKELAKNNKSKQISKTTNTNTQNGVGVGDITTSVATATTVDETEASSKCILPTKFVAIDCEMVGVGIEGKESVLARVSIVNSLGECLYDKFVKAKEKVVDYRTNVSGVRAEDLKDAFDYDVVQKEVSDLLNGRVLVGHALQNDLKCLMLSHSKRSIRDTAKYKPFQKLLKTKRPSLKRLADEILHKEIQVGEHNSVIDARVTMQIYKKFKKEWEKSLHCAPGEEETSIKAAKEVFMGNVGEKKGNNKKKVNKWKKIKNIKKQKEKDE